MSRNSGNSNDAQRLVSDIATRARLHASRRRMATCRTSEPERTDPPAEPEPRRHLPGLGPWALAGVAVMGTVAVGVAAISVNDTGPAPVSLSSVAPAKTYWTPSGRNAPLQAKVTGLNPYPGLSAGPRPFSPAPDRSVPVVSLPPDPLPGRPAVSVRGVDVAPLPTEPLKDLAEAAEEAPAPDAGPDLIRHVVTIERGDSLLGVIRSHDVSTAAVLAALERLEPAFDPSGLRIGDRLAFVVATPTHSEDDNAQSELLELAIFRKKATRAGHSWQDASLHERTIVEIVDGIAALRTDPIAPESARFIEGTIRSSFYRAAITAGASAAETVEMIRILEGSIDFSRDIRVGDRFALLLDPGPDGNPAIRHVALETRNRTIAYYRADFADGNSGYFDATGTSHESLLNFRPLGNARLTSGFGPRVHPVHKVRHLHRGLDFRARPGTPIPAAGAGVVVQVGWRGGYGRYLRIRHNGRYMTAYAHMKAFAEGMRVGARVKRGEIIGYVGSSGLSTGPHLHFEVLVDGRHTDPRTLDRVKTPPLEGERMEAFRALVLDTDALLAKMRSTELAAAAETGNASPVRRK